MSNTRRTPAPTPQVDVAALLAAQEQAFAERLAVLTATFGERLAALTASKPTPSAGAVGPKGRYMGESKTNAHAQDEPESTGKAIVYSGLLLAGAIDFDRCTTPIQVASALTSAIPTDRVYPLTRVVSPQTRCTGSQRPDDSNCNYIRHVVLAGACLPYRAANTCRTAWYKAGDGPRSRMYVALEPHGLCWLRERGLSLLAEVSATYPVLTELASKVRAALSKLSPIAFGESETPVPPAPTPEVVRAAAAALLESPAPTPTPETPAPKAKRGNRRGK